MAIGWKVAAAAAVLALAGSAGAEMWTYPGGSFENTGGRNWVQRRADGDAGEPFVEVRRTADYVELFDARRLLYVQLCADEYRWRYVVGPTWMKGADRCQDGGPGETETIGIDSAPDLIGD